MKKQKNKTSQKTTLEIFCFNYCKQLQQQNTTAVTSPLVDGTIFSLQNRLKEWFFTETTAPSSVITI